MREQRNKGSEGMNNLNLFEITMNMLLAALGGIVKRLVELENSKEDVPAKFFVISALIGVFTGMLVYFALKGLNWNEYVIVACVSLSGFMGNSLLKVLSKIAVLKIEKESGVEIKNEEKENEK